MKKLIIFTSGDHKAAERIVSLFNEGNRITTSCVFTDQEDNDFKVRMETHGCSTVLLNEEVWDNRKEDIIGIVKNTNPDLIIIDGWEKPVPKEIAELANYHVVMISTPEEAPREVMTAIESLNPNLLIPVTPEEKGDKTMDEEWAESLKINFQPPKIDDVPPPIPMEETNQSNGFSQNAGPLYGNQSNGNYTGNQSENIRNRQGFKDNNRYEPMPSTYLIWSVLCTIFCCFIPGIIAIIFSSQVSSKYYSGDIEGARRASRNAEGWIIASFVLGVLTATLYLPIMLIN